MLLLLAARLDAEAAEERPIEWFAPAGFARDYWVAKHRANKRRPTGRERVVFFGDSVVDQWAARAPASPPAGVPALYPTRRPLPRWLFLGQELDELVLEAPDGRKTAGAGWTEFFLAHMFPL